MWHTVKRAAISVFWVLAVVGLLDMAHEAFTHSECGPIFWTLTRFFPNSPGAAKCDCGTGEHISQRP